MAGFNASPADAEYGFSRPHLIGMGVLSLGALGVLAFSAFRPEETPQPPKVQPIMVETRTWQPPPEVPAAEPEPPGDRIPPKAKPAVAERSWKKFLARKRQAVKHVAAVAEKPAEEINLRPNWNHLVEFELEADLWNRIPTVGMNDIQAAKAIEAVRSAGETSNIFKGPEELIASVCDKDALRGLPLQTDSNCRLEENVAKSLQWTALKLHRDISMLERTSPRRDTHASVAGSERFSHDQDYSVNLARRIFRSDFDQPGAVRAMVQILQAEPAPVRLELVKNLKTKKEPEITGMLLDPAMYDLSKDVRHAANEALTDRPLGEFRAELLKAFRYPWEPVAWRAAETLMILGDQKSVPALVDLLDAPDPTAPYLSSDGEVVVRELVKINHMRNCLLCHAPSKNVKDLVRAPIPVPGEKLQPVYYGGSLRFSRSHIPLVRADVTYLRQDFSVVHSMENQSPWPELQRFDYLVRTREAKPDELAAWDQKPSEEKRNYSQRNAVLAALRSLTHQDLGEDSRAWREEFQKTPAGYPGL